MSAPPARFLLRRRIANSTSSTSISDSRILSQQLIDSDACSLIVYCEALRDSFEEHCDWPRELKWSAQHLRRSFESVTMEPCEGALCRLLSGGILHESGVGGFVGTFRPYVESVCALALLYTCSGKI